MSSIKLNIANELKFYNIYIHRNTPPFIPPLVRPVIKEFSENCMENIMKKKMLILKLFLVTFITTFFGCASVPGKNDSSNLILIKAPKEIVNPSGDVKKFFQHEWDAINQRRYLAHQRKDYPIGSDHPPRNTIGLALSGGGIRSNAFQLGILAGFYEAGCLPEIDYISSVSGGSWAAASYLFTKSGDHDFFNGIDQLNSRHLIKKQGELNREEWRKAIVKSVLPETEGEFRDLLYKDLSVKENLMEKPYFIINATHSNMPTEFPTEYNFNIQFTRDAIIAPADCKSEGDFCSWWFQKVPWSLPTAGGLGKGFMIRNRKDSDYQLYVNTFLSPWQYTQELRLSDILTASSAVVTKSYGNWISIKKNGITLGGGPEGNLRDKYRLSDGGKSENLGAIALMQRGVDMIIVSQMAQDSNIEFSDFKLLNNQLKNKFEMEIYHGEAIKENIKCRSQLYSESKYGYGKNNEKATGEIIFIKPTFNNIYGFKKWLKNKLESAPPSTTSKLQLVWDALYESTNKKSSGYCFKVPFPQHPTFSFKYEDGIIQAYYLLGKYVIETTDIKNRINKRAISSPKE